MEFVLTFNSTHEALATEKEIAKYGYIMQLMAAPRSVDSRCGFSILLNDITKNCIETLISGKGINFAGLYQRKSEEGVLYYEKIC